MLETGLADTITYRSKTGRRLSELAANLLSDFLEEKGYLTNNPSRPVRAVAEKLAAYGKKKQKP